MCPGEDVGYDNLGMELVSGKVRSGLGVLADGVFVRRIRRGSPAEQDGRYDVNGQGVCLSVCFCSFKCTASMCLSTRSRSEYIGFVIMS